MTGTGGEGPFREEDPMAGTETFSCPKCGHQLAVGTPICGNCGTILQGGPHVPEPLAASGIRPGPIIVLALVVAVVVAVFLGREQIKDAIDSVSDAFETETEPGDQPDIDIPPIGGNGGDKGDKGGNDDGGRAQKGARGVPEVVRELRAAGIPCSPAHVDSSDEFVETGNCQSNGQHVQINLYFTPETMEFARNFYADFAFASVHRDNWWISGDTALMRRIHAAVGGRFQPPS